MKRNLLLLLICAGIVGGGTWLADRYLPQYFNYGLLAAFGLCLLVVALFGKDTPYADIPR